MDKWIPKHNFEKAIVGPGLIILLSIVLGCMIFPKEMETTLSSVKTFIFDSFSSVYILCVSFFLFFLLFLCMGKLGDIRLGEEDDEPDFSIFSWICMLFAAGMGIGLMYFGVAEPISHYAVPLHSSASETTQLKEAMGNTLFHWGIHAWAIYGIIGLSLAYFGFRYHLPLTIRSGFYPILKDRIHGFWGHAIDVVAFCATIFGLTTTLGYGALQLNAGLMAVGVFEETTMTHLVILIIIAISLAILSAISGVSRGIRLLSNSNLLLAIGLMLFIFISGPTITITSALSENIGYYLTHLVELSFRTFAYEPSKETWFTSWTVLYWAWWISWAPFVGLFIAKISKGRTIREFVIGVLLVPTLFNILWMTIFGNGAIALDQETGGLLSASVAKTEGLLFLFLSHYPFPLLTSTMALLIIAIFFVTSADSGIFVLNSITSYGKKKFPKWQSIFWGALMALLAIALLRSGGLGALQTMTVLMALPFALIMVLMSLCLLQGLLVDNHYFSRELSKSTAYWDGTHWKSRLQKIISPNSEEDFARFVTSVVRPAFRTMEEEFKRNGIHAEIKESTEGDVPAIELIIKTDRLRNFLYGVTYKEFDISPVVVEDPFLPTINTGKNYEPICYFFDGRRGYSVKYMREDELISDILKQYERFIRMASDTKHNLYLFDK